MPGFNGLRVLTLESRRAAEISTLVRTFGGEPLSAPALREVPLESNAAALGFAAALERGDYDIVVFMTGAGLRAILEVAAASRASFVAALSRARIVARGPKPVAVLRELGVTPWVVAPEPNTWRELMAAIDAAAPGGVRGARVAVQEYGRSNPELLEALRARGSAVTAVPVYRYALPEDLEPLRRGVSAVAAGEVDVVLLTTGTQAFHLFQVAEQMRRVDELRGGLARAVIASIGPTTSEALVELGIDPDMEPSHPKMGILVREAAERAPALLAAKRQR